MTATLFIRPNTHLRSWRLMQMDELIQHSHEEIRLRDAFYTYDDTVATEAPGFGFPLNYYPAGEGIDRPFPSALSPRDMCAGRATLALTTLREFKMLQLMNQITDKPRWDTKIYDETISQKWKQEAMRSGARDVSANMVDWVIDELRYKAQVYGKTGAVSVYTGDVVKSDYALPESFKLQLQAAVKPLEDVQEKDKDWHPGSNGLVRDLVHPSLFPLVYGRTRVLAKGITTLENCTSMCGAGLTIPIPPEDECSEPSLENSTYSLAKSPYSRKFQWLPCEVDVSGRIMSYINNLHPERHKGLYGLIEAVIEAAIPLWNMSLAPMIDCRGGGTRMKYHGSRYYSASRETVQPDPGKFAPPVNPPLFDLRQTFAWQGLQIVVKLANVELMPEKPEYSGGKWHVEGQLNEHICATALYYYSNENVQDSTLSFRQQSDPLGVNGISYEQDVHDWLTDVYGCNNSDPSIQYVGGVSTREGRLLTFPNILQHQAQPFSLKDRTKSGHRKILALFLVDPHIRILSTANVPPQQKEWWIEHLNEAGTVLDKMPQELREEIFQRVGDDFPYGLTEAKALREELIGERRDFEVKQTNAFNSLEFSLCEH